MKTSVIKAIIEILGGLSKHTTSPQGVLTHGPVFETLKHSSMLKSSCGSTQKCLFLVVSIASGRTSLLQLAATRQLYLLKEVLESDKTTGLQSPSTTGLNTTRRRPQVHTVATPRRPQD